jgi:pimeloyl-ACP methyl ester carboxylesterase
VHGGLNSYKDSIKRAEYLYPKITDAGCFPVFVSWRSALWTCYWEHLYRIRQGRVHRGYGWFTWLYYLIADVGRAIFRIPAALYLQVINDCKPYLPKQNPEGLCAAALFKALRKRARAKPRDSIKVAEALELMTPQEKRHLLIRLIATYLPKIVSGAVIDAVGKSAWDNMLRRTKTLFRKPEEFDIRDHFEDAKKVEATLDATPSGALSIFLAELSKHINENNNNNYKITLVGHSMGTIVLNTVLQEYPDLPCEDIVYMGAACSIQDFIASVIPFLKNHINTKFYNLCLHPVAEQTEASAYEVAPRGSLLIWIDNFLASPQTIPDRTLGCWENVLQTTHMIPRDLRGRIHIKAFDAGANAVGPRRHGDFGKLDSADRH